MTQPTLYGLRTYQFGKEATRGTAVPATSKMAVDVVDFEPLDMVHRPPIAKGLLHRYVGSETVITRGTSIKVPSTELVYDQIQNFLSSLKGGVSGTGAPSVYVWTYAPSLTADSAPDSWTLERRLSDGSNNIDEQFAYVLWSELTFEWEVNKPIMFSATGFGRRVQSSAITAALALPTIEIPPSPLTKVWIDSTWATLGSTQVTGQVLKGKATIKTGLKPKHTFDGRTDLDFTTYVLDGKERGFDLEATIMVESGGQFATEKTAAEAQTLRAVRFKTAGTGSRYFQLDFLGKHDKGSLFHVGQEDGQDIFDLKLVDSDDATNFLQAVVSNAVASYI